MIGGSLQIDFDAGDKCFNIDFYTNLFVKLFFFCFKHMNFLGNKQL